MVSNYCKQKIFFVLVKIHLNCKFKFKNTHPCVPISYLKSFHTEWIIIFKFNSSYHPRISGLMFYHLQSLQLDN